MNWIHPHRRRHSFCFSVWHLYCRHLRSGRSCGYLAFVLVDDTGKLGTHAVDANGNQVALPSPKVTLNDSSTRQKRVAELEDTVARLAATVKEQAAQIQKVSAQVEVNKPAPQLVVNKP